MGVNDSGQLYISSQLSLFVHSVNDMTIKSDANINMSAAWVKYPLRVQKSPLTKANLDSVQSASNRLIKDVLCTYMVNPLYIHK